MKAVTNTSINFTGMTVQVCESALQKQPHHPKAWEKQISVRAPHADMIVGPTRRNARHHVQPERAVPGYGRC